MIKMKIIDCDKKNKKGESEIHKYLKQLKDKIIEHKIFVDKNLEIEKFFEQSEENLIHMRFFLYNIDIKVACAFVENGLLRFCISFKYPRKKRKKVIQIVNEYINELEQILSYLDDIKISEEEMLDIFYIDAKKQIT